MPNHVRNKVKMTGIAKLPIFTTATDEYTKEPYTFFDFNKLIPMPESLNVESGSTEDVAIEAVLRKIGKRRYGFLCKNYGLMSDEEYEKKSTERRTKSWKRSDCSTSATRFFTDTQPGMIGAVKIGEPSGTHMLMSR